MDLSPTLNASPMMVAHAAARVAAPGHLVLYRVGEFYEVLRDDAVVVSRTLGIQLTRRRQKEAADVPMCGIPAAIAGSAVSRLLAAGHKVALSEQSVDPSGERPLNAQQQMRWTPRGAHLMLKVGCAVMNGTLERDHTVA